MYKVGMYGGSFNPLHLGHVNAIIKASNICEKLYIILHITKNNDEINYKERLLWLNEITKHMDNISIIEMFDNQNNKDNHDWQAGSKFIKDTIKTSIDVIFVEDDYKGENIYESLYPESKIIYFDREEVNISSTKIRKNPFKYFNYLPRIVQKNYIKKVCIIGTESCGKTILAKNLANYFNTSYVLEAGRDICEKLGSPNLLQRKDYFDILLEQKSLEKKAIENANKVVFIDTDSLYTLFFYQMEYNGESYDKNIKQMAESISFLNDYDLYIFLEPDTKFVQDGYRTNASDEFRQMNNNKLKDILQKNEINYVSISGSYDERYNKSKQLVKELLKEKTT